MPRTKAIPPPSPSSSGSESQTSTSSYDEEEPLEQQRKEVARTKASPSPVKKIPAVVPKQQQDKVPQERMASPPAKKKPVLKSDKKPPPPVSRSAADASSGEEEDSDSPPKAKPAPSFSRPRNLKPVSSSEPSTFSKPEVPISAAAGQQSHRAKERKRQREEAGDKQEGDASAAASQQSHKAKERKRQREEAGDKQEGDAAAVAASQQSHKAKETKRQPEEAGDKQEGGAAAAAAASSHQSHKAKETKQQREEAGDKQEGDAAAVAASQQSHKAKETKRQPEEAGDKQEGGTAAGGRSSSKKLFQRVWTVENEIALLEGMLDFQEKHGGPLPATVSDALFEFISSTLQGNFSKMQLYSKIRGLRKKHETNLRRGKKDADPSFAKPHEQVAFELSKKLWPTAEGDAHDYRGNGTSVNPKDKGKKTGHQGASPLYPSLTEAISLLGKEDDNSFLAQTASRALESLKPTKLKALEDRWTKHFIAGVNYFMERARLKKDLLQSLVGIIDSE